MTANEAFEKWWKAQGFLDTVLGPAFWKDIVRDAVRDAYLAAYSAATARAVQAAEAHRHTKGCFASSLCGLRIADAIENTP